MGKEISRKAKDSDFHSLRELSSCILKKEIIHKKA
jgi:hypothetical protein